LSGGSIGSPIEVHDGPLRGLFPGRLTGWLLPLVFVLVFVLVAFVPGVSSGTDTVDLADLGVLAVTILALVRVHRDGVEALRGSMWLWVGSLALLLYVAAASLYPTISDPDYAWKTHLATAVKFAEYFVLAPVTAVLLRDRTSIGRFYAVIAGFTAVAAAIAVLQLCGVHIFRAWPAGERQPSFTGVANLGTLGAAALALAFLGVLWPGSITRRVTAFLLVSGLVAVVISAEIAAGLGLGGVLLVSLFVVHKRRGLEPRRVLLVCGVTAICALGLLVMRAGDFSQFARSFGIMKAQKATTENIQTYAQRTLMLYIGLRIFEAHPIFGAGWQSVREYHVYSPFLAAAHRRFPNESAQSFPSPQNRWGVDNAYVESLAELGLVGTAFFLAFLGITLGLGLRGSLRAPPPAAQLALAGLLWMIVTMGIWAGEGFDPGSGFAALAFFAIGLIAAARALPPGPAETEAAAS
jgi:O-antigen ligase